MRYLHLLVPLVVAFLAPARRRGRHERGAPPRPAPRVSSRHTTCIGPDKPLREALDFDGLFERTRLIGPWYTAHERQHQPPPHNDGLDDLRAELAPRVRHLLAQRGDRVEVGR